jgi:hypothetical protein
MVLHTEYCYAECRYAESRYVECRGASKTHDKIGRRNEIIQHYLSAGVGDKGAMHLSHTTLLKFLLVACKHLSEGRHNIQSNDTQYN